MVDLNEDLHLPYANYIQMLPWNGGPPESASFPWSYGHFVDGYFRTIMSYRNQCIDSCPRVPHFSNPNVFEDGFPTGIEDERDNHRTGNCTADVIANNRASVEAPCDQDPTGSGLPDTDGDGLIDACDADDDNDGLLDVDDNCPLIANPLQTNADGDHLGDACDTDDDNDGLPDIDDNCPLTPNALQVDTDGDDIGDVCDCAPYDSIDRSGAITVDLIPDETP